VNIKVDRLTDTMILTKTLPRT